MGAKLKLHEAIVVVLIGKKDRTASFEEIADEINRRGLYIRKDNTNVPSYQIMQRTTLSGGQYRHLFEEVSQDKIKLRDL